MSTTRLILLLIPRDDSYQNVLVPTNQALLARLSPSTGNVYWTDVPIVHDESGQRLDIVAEVAARGGGDTTAAESQLLEPLLDHKHDDWEVDVEQEGGTDIAESPQPQAPSGTPTAMHGGFVLQLTGRGNNNNAVDMAPSSLLHDDNRALQGGGYSNRISLPTDVVAIGVSLHASAGDLNAPTSSLSQPRQLSPKLTVTSAVPWVGWGILLVAVVSLAGMGSAIDMQHTTPFIQSFWRGTSCTLVMLPWGAWSYYRQGWRGLREKRVLRLMLTSSLCWCVWMPSFLYALDNTSIAHAFVLTNLHSIVIVVARLVTRRVVPTPQLLGVAIGKARYRFSPFGQMAIFYLFNR